MFKNHIIDLNKLRHVWESYELHVTIGIVLNHNNHILENLNNLDNWLFWTFWELTCSFRSILPSDLGLNYFESCYSRIHPLDNKTRCQFRNKYPYENKNEFSLRCCVLIILNHVFQFLSGGQIVHQRAVRTKPASGQPT